MRQKPLCFIDVETTGLHDTAEIIEIALVKTGFFSTSVYTTKIKPLDLKNIDPVAAKINGYTPENWKDAPLPASVADDIAKFVSGCTLVGHNVSFDLKFLKLFLSSYSEYNPNKILSHRNICTMMLAHEHLVPIGLKSLSFDSIREFLGWTIRDKHDAYNDAMDCMRLYNTLIRCSRLKRSYIYVSRLGRRLWEIKSKQQRIRV